MTVRTWFKKTAWIAAGGAAWVLAVGQLAGCASAPTVTQSVLVPAGSQAAYSIKRVAVLPFDTRRPDADVSAEVEAMLAGVQVQGQAAFTVVERSRIQQVLREQRLSNSDAFSQDTAARLGRLVGAGGIYTGTVTRHEVNDRTYQETRSRCVQQGKKKGIFVRCERSEEYRVNCTERTASYTFLPKLISVERAAIEFSMTAEGQASAEHCQGDDGGLPERNQLLAQAKAEALGKLREQVAPSVREVSVAVAAGTDGMANAQAKAQQEGALAFMKAGRTDRACELWQEAARAETRAWQLIHNLGVCHETRGELEQAQARYKEADRLTTKPEAVLNDALARIQQRMRERSGLAAQTGSPAKR